MDELQFNLERSEDFDWINLDRGKERIGKIRCSVRGHTLTIYSIMIFPEYQGLDFGQVTLDRLKTEYEVIIADKVRFKAQGFWERMGFHDRGDGNWEYRRR